MQDATHHCGTFPHGEMGMKDPTQNDKPPIPFASRYSGVITVTPGSIPRPWGLSNVPVLTMSQFGPQAPRNENGVPSKPSSSVSEKTEHGMGKRDGSRGDQGNTVEQASALCYVPRSLDGFVSPQSLPHYHTEAIGMHVTHFPRPGPKPTHQYFGLPLMSMGPVNTPAPMHGPGMCCASLSPNTGGVTYDCPDSTFIYSTICQYQRMNQQLRESLSAARGEIEQLHQQVGRHFESFNGVARPPLIASLSRFNNVQMKENDTNLSKHVDTGRKRNIIVSWKPLKSLGRRMLGPSRTTWVPGTPRRSGPMPKSTSSVYKKSNAKDWRKGV